MLSNDVDPSAPSGATESAPATVQPRRNRIIVRTLLALALVGSALGGGFVGAAVTTVALAPPAAAAAQPTAAAAQPAQGAPTTAGAVFRKVGPAVVEVIVSGGTSRRGRTPSGSGSGIVVDQNGYILTNNHVVAGATAVQVRFSSGDTRTAQVVGSDRGNDLALLKVDLPANTPVAPLGDSDAAQVGDIAIAIGSPFGLEETVTQGIISAVHRDWQPDGAVLQRNMIQTDAPINPGNSGGALLNANGEVIGITTAIESPVRGSVGVGFAVPINTAKQLLPQLRAGATIEPVWLGIMGQALTPALAQDQGLKVQQGVLVGEVVANSPAAQAKLQANDVITAVDGSAVNDVVKLSAQLSSHKPGDTVKVTIVRGGQEQQITVTLQARPVESQ